MGRAAALAISCALVFPVSVSWSAVVPQDSKSGRAAEPTVAAPKPSSPSNAQLPDAPQPSQDRGSQNQASQDQGTQDPDTRGTGSVTAPTPEPANTAPPSSDTRRPDRTPTTDVDGKPEQSSSEQSRGDISPPKEDELAHPDAYSTAPGAPEWNPLRAMKDVEVGTFYYNAGNYKAAISRFREALEFKPRDAVATFKLAQALEKSGRLDEARVRYEAYLAILKNGPNAAEARKALARLNKK